jgi:hypothetical protein
MIHLYTITLFYQEIIALNFLYSLFNNIHYSIFLEVSNFSLQYSLVNKFINAGSKNKPINTEANNHQINAIAIDQNNSSLNAKILKPIIVVVLVKNIGTNLFQILS